MAWFKRDPVTSAGEYIKSADSVSRPMAVILSMIVFLVIAAAVFVIFLSIRWVYDRFNSNNKPTTTSQQSSNLAPVASPSPAKTSSSNSKTTTQTTSATTQTPVTTPNTGPSSTIPNTGPDPNEP
jgi:cytoskeletal protein RodZ